MLIRREKRKNRTFSKSKNHTNFKRHSSLVALQTLNWVQNFCCCKKKTSKFSLVHSDRLCVFVERRERPHRMQYACSTYIFGLAYCKLQCVCVLKSTVVCIEQYNCITVYDHTTVWSECDYSIHTGYLKKKRNYITVLVNRVVVVVVYHSVLHLLS